MLDTAAPSLARAWDHLLGGGASFAADRSLAQRLEALHPGLRECLAASRGYVADRVSHIARAGVDQYLDLGAGLPTRPATHHAACRVQRAARVVYVDRDPAVIEHARALVPLGVRYLPGDLSEPEQILNDSGITGLLDFSRPVGVVLALALHVLDPGTARAVVGVIGRALAPGSYLVITEAAGKAGTLPESVWPGGLAPDELASFFSGFEVLPPGITGGPIVAAAGRKPPAGSGPSAATGAGAAQPGRAQPASTWTTRR